MSHEGSSPGNHPVDRRRSWDGMLASVWFERALWLVSAALLLAALWMWAEGRIDPWRHGALASSTVDGTYASLHDALPDLSREPIEHGTPVARLEIERLGVSTVVAEGTSPEVLREAIGHLPNSARPGEPGGNIALAAHGSTWSRPLEDLRPGDRVLLRHQNGVTAYTVQWTRVVEPDAIGVVAPTGYPALTMIAHYPLGDFGEAPQRFIVRARRDEVGPRSARFSTAPDGTG